MSSNFNYLQLTAFGLAGLSAALFLGFLTHANSNLMPIHIIVSIAIVALFMALALPQAQTYYSYGRVNPIVLNYAFRAAIVLALYWTIIGVGHWTFTPSLVEDLDASL